MKEEHEDVSVIQSPVQRRCWLLSVALRTLPLDQAIELARVAESFIAEGERSVASPKQPANGLNSDQKPAQVEQNEQHEVAQRSTETRKQPLMLPPQERELLLKRLARGGATNAELATEFGISAKQVQGVRMGSAREIERRKREAKEAPAFTESQPSATVTDAIVRYLRQQDDVVVPDSAGGFLVNGRFRLGISELLDRANKMRRRRGQPEFLLNPERPVEPRLTPANQHPMFWGKPPDGHDAPRPS